VTTETSRSPAPSPKSRQSRDELTLLYSLIGVALVAGDRVRDGDLCSVLAETVEQLSVVSCKLSVVSSRLSVSARNCSKNCPNLSANWGFAAFALHVTCLFLQQKIGERVKCFVFIETGGG